MWTSMKSIAFAAASLLCLCVATAGAEDKPQAEFPPDSPKITPLVKGKGYFIHAIAPSLLVHTARYTGEMRVMISSSPGINYGSRSGIAGTATDKERLYVLYWEAVQELQVTSRQPPPPKFKEPEYQVIVFRLEDGKRLMGLSLKEGRLPSKALPVTFEKGPLELRNNGVSCFGVTFEFKGDKLESHKVEKP